MLSKFDSLNLIDAVESGSYTTMLDLCAKGKIKVTVTKYPCYPTYFSVTGIINSGEFTTGSGWYMIKTSLIDCQFNVDNIRIIQPPKLQFNAKGKIIGLTFQIKD